MHFKTSLLLSLIVSVGLAGCQAKQPKDTHARTLSVDGSSTVFPLSAAVAESFMAKHAKVNITVSESGTGSGMSRFCRGEIEVADASRAITPDEQAACQQNQITFKEIEVALDGITIVTNKANTWAKTLTTAQLRAIFEKDSKVKRWSDIPGTSGFPSALIHLYTPGTASGTFEFFTEKINHTKKVQRLTQVTQSEDDNVLVKGIVGDTFALGYFGYGYFDENKSKLHAIAIADERLTTKPISPSLQSIQNNTYPLARPLYIYVNQTKVDDDKTMRSFVTYYEKNAGRLAKEVKMIPMKGGA